MSRGDWRVKAVRVEPGVDLQAGQWYRTPLSDKDHSLGLQPAFLAEELAWCGKALGAARDWTEGEEFAGLWYTNRKSAHCAECNKREKEWYSS